MRADFSHFIYSCAPRNLTVIRRFHPARLAALHISLCVCLHPALSMTAIAAECAGINFPFGGSGATRRRFLFHSQQSSPLLLLSSIFLLSVCSLLLHFYIFFPSHPLFGLNLLWLRDVVILFAFLLLPLFCNILSLILYILYFISILLLYHSLSSVLSSISSTLHTFVSLFLFSARTRTQLGSISALPTTTAAPKVN